ncbi:MAG: HU family DNA-binding protein [Syntrophomonadaceae bacterium]|jgi:predicted histone-like DNA-binding protein|nr:HU family DNA-binding protein [Syntrophomonadaceae bacterium]
MAIKLKKIQRANPMDQAQVKWYLTQEKSGTVDMSRIVKDIQNRSALTAGDVRSVLDNLAEVLPVYLRLGQTVNLQGFGTFRASVSSEGTDTAEELTARKVKNVKIAFLPGKELKQSLAALSYEIIP